MPVRRLLCSSLFLAVLSLAVPAAASASLPSGFVGMNVGSPLFSSGVNTNAQLATMAASGVESIRVLFNWGAAQPYATWSDVPPSERRDYVNDPVPTSFTATDQIVGDAAAHGLQVLPTVLYTPWWDALPDSNSKYSQPADPDALANYLTLLVDRYGPHGTFWNEHPALPKVPIRMWQIWNEPNNTDYYWSDNPPWPSYVAVLKAAHDAIHQADPGAKVVLGGLSNWSWQYLQSIYEVPGASDTFDVVAIHPYTKTPQGVITILHYDRNVMAKHGDADKPILVTEVGWPSSTGKTRANPFQATEAQQASRISQVLPLLASNRQQLHLLGFDYYTWVGVEHPNGYFWFYAGLFRYASHRFVAKPAYYAFRNGALALEGCRLKGRLATICLQP